MQLNLTAPIVGRDRATELAIAALGVPGETVTSAELAIDFATGSQASAWQVSVGGETVRVDAASGLASIAGS
jgi:hypothetical protein